MAWSRSLGDDWSGLFQESGANSEWDLSNRFDLSGYSDSDDCNSGSDDFDSECEDYDDDSDESEYCELSPNEDDETAKSPLMIACERGDRNSVERLLRKGANVNETWGKDGNTALHFTCIDNDVMYQRTRRNLAWCIRARVAIAELLIEHGAVYKANLKGMTPIYLAGLNKMRELVEYLSGCSAVKSVAPSDEKIRGLEFIGVSHAIYEPRSPIACNFFLEARKERCQAQAPPEQSSFPELLECFGRTECNSPEALESIKSDLDALEIEAYLVAARIYPRENYPWINLVCCALKKLDKLPIYTKPLSLAVKQLVISQMYVSYMLDKLRNAVALGTDGTGICACLNDVMESFLSGLKEVDVEWVRLKSKVVSQKPTMILYRFVRVPCISTEALLTTVEKIITHVHEAIQTSPDRDEQEDSSLGCTWLMISTIVQNDLKLVQAFSDETLRKLQHVISRFLHLEGALHAEERRTMLHLLTYSFGDDEPDFSFAFLFDTEPGDWKRFFLSLTRMVVRHGCPVETKDWRDRLTARQQILDYYTHEGTDDPWERRFLDLLSVPSSPLSLEELSARCILRWKVHYRDILPKALCDFVSGENTDPYEDC